MIMQVPFKESPTKDTCVECGELVMIPPGVYHNGDSEQPMHKVCDSLRNKIDFNEENKTQGFVGHGPPPKRMEQPTKRPRR